MADLETPTRSGPGRPRGTDKKTISVRVPEAALRWLRDHAEEQGSNVSDLIREAIERVYREDGREGGRAA